MEKLIHKRLYSHFLITKFLVDEQNGFRLHHRTSDSISSLLTTIYNAYDSDIKAISLFFDLKKGFDTINHEILLIKLERAGVKGNCLKLLKNYLSNR